MLMRRTRAYGRSQLISVYLHPFCRTSLFGSQKSHKITKILYFLCSRSYKVIDVDTIKHITIACYDNIAKFCQKPGHQGGKRETPPLKKRYSAAIGSSSMKMVTNRHKGEGKR